MPIRRCRLFRVDAFTRQRFCGNPAVVVLDADSLSEAEMQTIAAEVNGETAFILEAESGDHDPSFHANYLRRIDIDLNN